jgi:O-antigen ligase
VGPLRTTLLEVLIFVTFIAYGATLWTEKRLPRARTAYDVPIVLLLIAGVIGVVVAPDHLRAVGIYRAYFLEAVAIFYIAVDLLRTREEVRTLLLVAAVGSSIMAVGEIVSFAYVFGHHQLILSDAPAFLNTSPNAVAMYLEPPLAFAAGFTAFATQPKERWIASVVLVLVLVAIILTLSRASYLSMAALAVVLVLSVPRRRLRYWLAGGFAVIGLLVLEVPFINQRIAGLGASAGLRSSIYSQTLHMLAERPIFGAGISGFPVRVAPFRPSTQVVELYPHDIWLTTWSELGLLGLVAFALIFFGLLWRGARALPLASDLWRPVLWGAVGALVLYLVHGFFDSPYWKNDLSVEFWMLAALQVVAVRSVRGRATEAT